ncbi:MAG: rhomboid family intramembrane serine protease [Muribaculaceae bacterium]|nr:rhomboid family intramembrane serine protease [Muribaculaceae bacterium]
MEDIFDRWTRYCGSRSLAWLIAINTAVFIVVWVATLIGNSTGLYGNFTMPWLCVSADIKTTLFHPWTVVSYMVTQYSFLHLLFNMLWLLWFGRFLMTTLADRHLLFLYIGGGLTGAIFFLGISAVASPSSAFLSGASASVLAVITACAFRTPDLRLMMFLFGEVKLKWVALACVVLTFAGIGGGNPGGQAAHIGGLLFGLLFSLLLRRGTDLSAWFSFNRTQHSSPRKHRNVRRDPQAVARAAAGRVSDMERLDTLLDKIRLSGYASLTPAEKQELNHLSRKIDK